jgi:hypothetical protein
LEAVAKGWKIPFPKLAEEVEGVGIAALAREGVPVPFDSMRNAIEKLRIPTRMPWAEAERRMLHSADRLVQTTLQELATRVSASGAVPVFVALDNVVTARTEPLPALQEASRAGFLVLDLFELWEGRDMNALRIAPWDNHPNAAGNRLIAERLHGLIEQHHDRLRLGTRPQ